jgi:diguanylate cyclase (GGDEF)-like protein
LGHVLRDRQSPVTGRADGGRSTGEQLADILSEFARTMLTEFPIEGILDHLVRRIVDVLPISAAGVTLVSPGGGPHYIAASDPSARRFEELQSELEEGPCLGAYRTNRAVSVPDLRLDDTFATFAPRALRLGLAAVFTFPLRQGHRRLGALDLYRDRPGGLSDPEMTTAQTLADVTSAYLVNAQGRADLEDSSASSHERAVHDALTGLPNRILLLERIEHAIVRSGRSKKIVAILFIDLDDFKSVNDLHGHQVGDELLIAVAERIEVSLRPGDTLARLSGDEFVVLCEELDDVAQVEIVASRIVECLERPFPLGSQTISISASVGMAFAGRSHHDGDQLLHTADLAMYQVKRRGGANHQIVDVHTQHLEEYQSGILSALGKAIERQELRVEYQPIVTTGNGHIASAEALIRWDHPVRGLIDPVTMIPLAERSGMIGEIGRWVLERACIDRKRWDGHGGAFTLAVNMSAHQIMAPEFVAMVAEVLADTHTDPGLITVEITEGALIRDSKRAHIVLDDLKELGLGLALDDFGIGYSSLSYLKQFPFDIVKIDQSFVTDIDRDKSSHAIVSKSVELAHLLGLTVTSEGVETVAQYLALAELGSDRCQGYYFARPLAPERLDELVSSSN